MKRYLKPVVQDVLIASAGTKAIALAMIDDFEVTMPVVCTLLVMIIWMLGEFYLLAKHGGKPSRFVE